MTDSPLPVPLTRLDILHAMERAFFIPPATTSEILATAEDSGARAEVAALHRLPEHRFGTVRDLRAHLPDIPVDT